MKHTSDFVTADLHLCNGGFEKSPIRSLYSQPFFAHSSGGWSWRPYGPDLYWMYVFHICSAFCSVAWTKSPTGGDQLTSPLLLIQPLNWHLTWSHQVPLNVWAAIYRKTSWWFFFCSCRGFIITKSSSDGGSPSHCTRDWFDWFVLAYTSLQNCRGFLEAVTLIYLPSKEPAQIWAQKSASNRVPVIYKHIFVPHQSQLQPRPQGYDMAAH